MPKPDLNNNRLDNIRRSFTMIVVVWTLLFGASVTYQVMERSATSRELARIQAKESVDKDVVYRLWNARHGGVYVPVTDKTRPNPYLESGRDRDVVTTAGKILTLINPAYMTREAHELGRGEYGLKGHITSLDPVRPENRADEWETLALQEFERGVKEF